MRAILYALIVLVIATLVKNSFSSICGRQKNSN